VEQLRLMAPFGRENPDVLLRLEGVVVALRPETFGQHNKHLSLRVATPRAPGRMIRIVGWNWAEHIGMAPEGTAVDLLVQPKISRWNGNSRLECNLIDMRLAT
jgi:hypothetical protein